METNAEKRHLTLIHGGPLTEGPISRLGLRKRVDPVSAKVWTFVIFSKAALIASIYYYFFG